MLTWDVFHSDRLEVERGLTGDEVRAALRRGDLVDDDLIRPAGTLTPWARLIDTPEFLDEPGPAPPAVEPTATAPPPAVDLDDGDDHGGLEVLDEGEPDEPPLPAFPEDQDEPEDDQDPREPDDPEPPSLEVMIWDDEVEGGEDTGDEVDPQEEDEAAAEFTLARGSAQTVEELDLAAMVDVAFQLVLFFLVTATTVLYKSLEVPKPNPETNPPAAAAQGRTRSLDDMKESYIVVEIDPAGGVKVDNEPIRADVSALAQRLRALRERTGRKAMLLSADFSTPHRSAVLAYDAANEIGLGIAIARPRPKPAGGLP